MITVSLQYVDDCPHWPTPRERLGEAIRLVGRDLFVVELHPIGVQDHAAAEESAGRPRSSSTAATHSPPLTPRSD